MPDTRTDTQGQVNLQQMAELEYCLQKYYNENYAPVLSVVKKELDAKKAEEAARYYEQNWSPFVEPSVAHHSQVQQLEWNSKDSEYVVSECMDRISKSNAIKADNEKFVAVYQCILMRDLGETRYKELSDSIGTDLGTFYFLQRLEDMQLHQLAEYELPIKSSFFLQAMERSWIGLAGSFTSSKKQSETEYRIKDIANRLDNPSLGRRLRDEAGALAVDTGITALATGGLSLSTVGVDAAFRVGVELWNPMGGKSDDEKSEEERSLTLFNNSTTVRQIIDASKKVKSSQSLFVQSLNKELNNKMKIQAYNPVVSDERIKSTQLQLLKEYAGKDKGESFLRLYSDIQTKSYGAYDVDRWDSAIGNIIGEPEPWMLKQDEKTLMNNAAWWGGMYYNMVNLKKDEQNVNGKKMSRKDVLVKAFHYTEALYRVQHGQPSSYYSQEQSEEDSHEVTADEFFHRNKEQTHKPASQQPSTDTTSTSSSDMAPTQNNQTANSPSAPSTEQKQQANTAPSMNMLQNQNSSVMPYTGNLGYWGSLFDTYGLSGFGQVGRNFGQVLAHLPEIMIGMFTGKLSNLKVKDNLLPLTSIMIGLFLPARTNPFLKFLFLGLGGLNLLNKAGQSALNDNPSLVKTYRKYDDEPLNSRITKPAVKGGTLIADFDGNPLVLKLRDNAVEAYNKGLLPLNTLANAALRSWDERHQTISYNYDKLQKNSQTTVITQGFKYNTIL